MKYKIKILTQKRRGTEVFIIILWLFFVLFFSCTKKEEKIPADIISKEKMVQLLVDYHLAEAQSQLNASFDDSKKLKQSFYKFIFEKHKTNFSQLKKSFDYYSAYPEIFSTLYDEVITELSKKQAEASGKPGSTAPSQAIK